jgi:hypothetical protein
VIAIVGLLINFAIVQARGQANNHYKHLNLTTMADTKVFSFPDNNGNNGGFLGGNGWGGGILGFLLGLMFGNGGFGGWGGFGGIGGNGGAGFLSNQLNNDNGRDLLMQAITSQGEQSRQAISTLSTMLGQDFNLVNSSIQTITSALNQVANNQGLNAMQIVNSIQSGNASLASQLCQCCCQTQSTVNNGFGEVQRAIADKAAADQLGTCQQTYALTENANRNNQAILDKLSTMETRALQDKLDAVRERNTQLSGEISQLNQNQYIAGVVGQSMAPLNAQLAALNKEVDDIKCKMPNTVPVQYPNIVAANATPYMGFYGGYGYNGGGFWG